jgi:hypothetical protein
MKKYILVLGVTDYAADARIDAQIDGLMDKIYREKYWKDGGDKWAGPLDKLGKVHRINLIDPMTGMEMKTP